MKKVRVILSILVLALALTGCAGKTMKQGVKQLKNGQYKEAKATLSELTEKKKYAPAAYRGIGIACWELGDYEGAADAMNSALKAGAPETAEIYAILGSSELQIGDAKSALAAFEKGLKQEDLSDSLKQEMQFNSIVACERMNDIAGAKERLNNFLKEHPDNEEAKRELEFLATR